MSSEKDSRLVDYLYDELSDGEAEEFERTLESDDALSSELAGFEETLEALRSVEAEEPSPHLDSLILASARQAADEAAAEESNKGLRGWLRKMMRSPIAGLVAAGSVAMIAALVAVPSMMRTTSEEAPTAVEQVERLPNPITASEPAPVRDEAVKLLDPAEAEEDAAPPDEPAAALHEAPKKKKAALKREVEKTPPLPAKPAATVEPRQAAKAEPKPAVEAPAAKLDQAKEAKDEKKARTTFSYGGETAGAGDDAPMKDAETGAVGGAPRAAGPPAPPPAPAERPPEVAVVPQGTTDARLSRKEAIEKSADKSETAEIVELQSETKTKANRPDPERRRAADEAAREERGRSMLKAASYEFKRGNPVSGRQILVNALTLVGNAPVHAEIAFRLAQHDFDRHAWAEAKRYATIAASAPKFDKRTAALELIVEADKHLADERSKATNLELAPATQPPADADDTSR